MTDVREQVRERYAQAAVQVQTASSTAQEAGCCGDGCGSGESPSFGSKLYDVKESSGLPNEAVLASLGCGNPTAVADLHEGETVLDLGSGGGIDVLLSAKRVGPKGKAYGLDMTDEMLDLAVENKAKAGLKNVEFLKGFIEAIPLPANTVDVVISNCVINLSADKPSVFREMMRVLRPGGRIGISDIVATNDLTPEQRMERGSYVGCIAGALSFAEYETQLKQAGFEAIWVEPTHSVADSMYSATIKARKPTSPRPLLPIAAAGSTRGCCS